MKPVNIVGLTLAGLLAVAVGQRVASAQAPAPPAPAVPAPGGNGGDGLGMAQQVQLGPQEQLAEANRIASNMEGVRSSINRDLAEAREQRDVVKTLCLNDKLNQIDVAIRSAGERQRALELAVNRNDADLGNHEFTILSVLDQRAEQLDAEAKQCIGKEVGFVGESSVTMDIDPNLPSEDPTALPDPELTKVVEPPQCASCFR